MQNKTLGFLNGEQKLRAPATWHKRGWYLGKWSSKDHCSPDTEPAGAKPTWEYPVNTLTPHLNSEQIWAHLFLHYWQMSTKEGLKGCMCLTSWYHWLSIREYQNIPKVRRTETLHCWQGDTTVSSAFICSSDCGTWSWVHLLHTFI